MTDCHGAMINESGLEGYQAMSSLCEENLFKLQCIFKATEIEQSAQCKYPKKLFLAFTTGNAEIILYYKKETTDIPIVKRIPWFQGLHKQVSALCFHPLGFWLLTACADGSIHILPALPLVDDTIATDKRWNMEDITSFPAITSQSSHCKPSAIIWWQDVETPADIAIIGTVYGEIIFMNLETGHQISVTHVTGCVTTLHICNDSSSDGVSSVLLITNEMRQQWRLLLDDCIINHLRQSENEDSCDMHSNDNLHYHNNRTFPTSRSRSQGLKQLSLEKLAIFRQKFIELRNSTTGENTPNDIKNNRGSNNSTLNTDSSLETNQSRVTAELIPRDTFLMPQCDKEGRHLYTCYHAKLKHITVHGPDCSAEPLSVHRVFDSFRNVLLTQRFFFVSDISQRIVYIVSDRLSEIRTNDNCKKFNPECIVGRFSLANRKEVIRAMYLAPDFLNNTSSQPSQDVESKYVLPKGIADIKIELPHIDTCIIITNHSVYKIILRKSLLFVFMDMVLRKNELQKPMHLATIFGVNAQQLLEQAGDILLYNKEFSRAAICYEFSKCRLLKGLLKFASAGYTADVLSGLTHCLISPAISELPVTTRISLSNLCVVAFIEVILRISPQKSKSTYKEFLNFLSTNMFYDELLAINVAGQTCLWEVLHHLATQRGLYGQMLEILMKSEETYSTSVLHPSPYGLLICASEPNLMQAMLVNPELARSHMSFICTDLRDSQIFVLQRLVTLYDPTSPVIRPRIVRCKARRRTTSHSSQSSQCDSIELTEDCDDGDTLIENIIETFLLVLLTLIYKKSVLRQESTTTHISELLQIRKEYSSSPTIVDFKRRPLSAGFSHAALIRNGTVYTWGNSIQGCLGTGSSIVRYDSPRAIPFFRTMQVEVLSVSCGHCHTMAVTNNGIYVWGSSQFGQLGLGKMLRCSTPELVTALAQEVITDAVAGQYHSVALTFDGRVFTWGWGVHGQLGHGNTDQKNIPTLVTSLLGIFVRSIAAGHAHTLALSTDGVVYSFGSNVFGQLGIGSSTKCSIPMKISMTERINLIATSYFHNLALSNTNKLYIWGASPQVLRLQAQAQKKTRIQEQQEAFERLQEQVDEMEKMADDTNVNDTNANGPESNAQDVNTQVKSNSNEARRKLLDHASFKNINVGMLEESQLHLTPSLVDTSLVKGEIIQITTGCHHNALVTKDGSLYTWGRNLDGQIGNHTRREVQIPTPLCYNPASIFAQVPPRHKKVDDEQDLDRASKCSTTEKNGNVVDEDKASHIEGSDSKGRLNPAIKTVGVSCGSNYTIAIQPGGTVIAWGNNSKAELGRRPAKDTREDKLLLLKSSKRVVRLPYSTHVALDVPSQVPNIPAPIISYQSYDIPSLTGLVRPLSVIEKSPGELTLHYVLEQFSGLYDYLKIMKECLKLGNNQACSKIAMLQHNIVDAYSYQLKVLNALSLRLSSASTSLNNLQEKTKPKENGDMKQKSASLTRNYKNNTELFNKHVERNLIESVEDCAARNKMKIPTSKSLNSLHSEQLELHTFDCQGGSEELCRDIKSGNTPLDVSEDAFESDLSSDSEDWAENQAVELNEALRSETPKQQSTKDFSASTSIKQTVVNNPATNGNRTSKCVGKNVCSRNNLMNETIRVIKFYFVEMEYEPDTIKYKILQDTLKFWTQHNLPMQNLENLFLDYLDSIFYPLGLLLFCPEIMEKYLDANKNPTETKNSTFSNAFSVKFCLEVCSMLFHHIDQDQPCPEYVKLLFSLAADYYGPPLTGFPDFNGTPNTKQMIEGIISTMSSGAHNPRSFVLIKDPEEVSRFLANESDTMVFTCGHHFPSSVYESKVVPTMEMALLMSKTLMLPCTAQFLGKMFSDTTEPEILCPECVPRALGTLVKKSNE